MKKILSFKKDQHSLTVRPLDGTPSSMLNKLEFEILAQGGCQFTDKPNVVGKGNHYEGFIIAADFFSGMKTALAEIEEYKKNHQEYNKISEIETAEEKRADDSFKNAENVHAHQPTLEPGELLQLDESDQIPKVYNFKVEADIDKIIREIDAIGSAIGLDYTQRKMTIKRLIEAIRLDPNKDLVFDAKLTDNRLKQLIEELSALYLNVYYIQVDTKKVKKFIHYQ